MTQCVILRHNNFKTDCVPEMYKIRNVAVIGVLIN